MEWWGVVWSGVVWLAGCLAVWLWSGVVGWLSGCLAVAIVVFWLFLAPEVA